MWTIGEPKLYNMELSLVDLTLNDTSEATKVIENATGGRHIDFGSDLNLMLHKANPDTNFEIKHGCYSVWQKWNLDPNDIHPNGLIGHATIEVNRSATEDEKRMITDVINNHVIKMLPDVLQPDASDIKEYHQHNLSSPFRFGEAYSQERAEAYREAAKKQESQEADKLLSLYTPKPYFGERYKVGMDFTLSSPVRDIDKTVEELSKLPIEYIVMDNWNESNPRNIVGTSWKFDDAQHGTLQFEITNPLKEQNKAVLNWTAHEFEKKGAVTKFFKEHDLVDMSKCPKGKVFESFDHKFHEIEDEIIDAQDFADAVANIPTDDKKLQQ